MAKKVIITDYEQRVKQIIIRGKKHSIKSCHCSSLPNDKKNKMEAMKQEIAAKKAKSRCPF